MVDQHRAISIDIDQRAGLVHEGSSERYPEFHGSEGNPLFHERMFVVKPVDLLPAEMVI